MTYVYCTVKRSGSQSWSLTNIKLVKNKNLHVKKKVLLFFAHKILSAGYFDEVGGNSKQTIDMFYFGLIHTFKKSYLEI